MQIRSSIRDTHQAAEFERTFPMHPQMMGVPDALQVSPMHSNFNSTKSDFTTMESSLRSSIESLALRR